MKGHCIVTGATSGIGRAIAVRLIDEGFSVLASGRNEHALETLKRNHPDRVSTWRVDFTDDGALRAFAAETAASVPGIRALVHCAGVHHMGDVSNSAIEQLDEMYRINLRAPYLLTQALLPALELGRGWIVFMNSSAGKRARRGIGGYAATKFGLRALADSLRDEVNARGIRVLSVYPGRTATPAIKRVFEMEGKEFNPAALVQPEDIAGIVVDALRLPDSAELTEFYLRPARKSY